MASIGRADLTPKIGSWYNYSAVRVQSVFTRKFRTEAKLRSTDVRAVVTTNLNEGHTSE